LTVCDAVLACCGEPGAVFLAVGVTSSFVFVVGADIADRSVQPDLVVLVADSFELGVEFARAADVF
jgi:hypothetical protein